MLDCQNILALLTNLLFRKVANCINALTLLLSSAGSGGKDVGIIFSGFTNSLLYLENSMFPFAHISEVVGINIVTSRMNSANFTMSSLDIYDLTVATFTDICRTRLVEDSYAQVRQIETTTIKLT